eukprot:749950-Pelagomonas_calceolata.AAC.1
MDSALHIFSGCQCPVIHNMVTERHNIASIMILKEVSEGSYGSNLMHMDGGSADRLAQHDLQITEQVSNHVIPPFFFDPSIMIPEAWSFRASLVDRSVTVSTPGFSY